MNKETKFSGYVTKYIYNTTIYSIDCWLTTANVSGGRWWSVFFQACRMDFIELKFQFKKFRKNIAYYLKQIVK